MTATIASPRATSRQWAGLAVLALPTLLLSIDIFVLLLALPNIDLPATRPSIPPVSLAVLASRARAGLASVKRRLTRRAE